MEKVRIGVKRSRQLRLSKVFSDASQPLSWLPRNVSGIKPNGNAYTLLRNQILCHIDIVERAAAVAGSNLMRQSWAVVPYCILSRLLANEDFFSLCAFY
jgi:hypothetical protein